MDGKLAYRLSPLAKQDLEAIWLYTSKRWSTEQANRYCCSIISAIEDLLTICLPDASSHSLPMFSPNTGNSKSADTSSSSKNRKTTSM